MHMVSASCRLSTPAGESCLLLSLLLPPLYAFAASAVAVADDATEPPPPPVCQARMDAYCNSYGTRGVGCAPPFDGGGRSVCPKHVKYVARKDHGSNLTKQWDQVTWRCYSEAMLSADRAHYVNGTCYCTQTSQLAWLLCNCTNGKDCGSAPHPEEPSPCLVPAPPPPQDLTFVDVFTLNSTLNTCYRIPLITYTASGTLLAIAEERYDASQCPDNYPTGQPGGHNQVSRRSTDAGKTWGPIIRQVGSLENLKAVGGVDYTNPSVVNVKTPQGKTRILYQYSTQNNPSAPEHGHTVQMWSDDDGLSWGDHTDSVSQQLEAQSSLAAAYPGATPGPIQGVQVGSRLVMCAWGSKGTKRGTIGWEPGMANFLYFSENYGTNWTAAAPLEGQTFNECQVTALSNGSIVLVSRQAQTPLGQPHSYYITTYAPDLQSRGPVRRMRGVDTPTCEGSLVQHDGVLYFAHPSSQHMRMNLTIHKSEDGGESWPTSRVIWPPCTAGYSGLTATPHGLALIFEGGGVTPGGQWHDSWVKATVIPYF